MLPLSKVQEFWVNALGLSRATDTSTASKKKKKREKYVKKDKLGSKAVKNQMDKEEQLKAISPKPKKKKDY